MTTTPDTGAEPGVGPGVGPGPGDGPRRPWQRLGAGRRVVTDCTSEASRPSPWDHTRVPAPDEQERQGGAVGASPASSLLLVDDHSVTAADGCAAPGSFPRDV